MRPLTFSSTNNSNLHVCTVPEKESVTMVTISEVKGNARENRTASHTHIKGLGLRSDGYAEENAAGWVGQKPAREVGEKRKGGNLLR